MRRATEPFGLGSHAFPAGAIVVLSSLVTHRDPLHYPSPHASARRAGSG
jgi:cytochrome P450